jgi:hypothetical protein
MERIGIVNRNTRRKQKAELKLRRANREKLVNPPSKNAIH